MKLLLISFSVMCLCTLSAAPSEAVGSPVALKLRLVQSLQYPRTAEDYLALEAARADLLETYAAECREHARESRALVQRLDENARLSETGGTRSAMQDYVRH